VNRWLRVVALAATLWSAAAPVVAMPIGREVAVQVSESRAREQKELVRAARPARAWPPITTLCAPEEARFALVLDRYLRHCALLR
jgi:hypothetical protein